MPVQIALVNLTNDEIGIRDLGTRLLGPSGTTFDITGLFLPEELRQSEDLLALAASGSVTLSGVEGLTPSDEIVDFLAGSQFQSQNFTTTGVDLRAIRNTEVEGNDYVTVASGVGGDGVVTYYIGTNDAGLVENIVKPTIKAETPAIVGDGIVTIISGTNTITISGSEHADPLDHVGELYQLTFVHEGSDSKNRWLGHHGDTSLTSDRSPAIIPWDSKLVSITYTNRDNNSDIDLEIYSVHEMDTTQKDVEFVWNLRDARVARKTNFSPDVLFEAGDRVAVYVRDKGVNPDYVVFTMYLQITEDNSEEVVRSFSGDLSVGGTPETDS